MTERVESVAEPGAGVAGRLVADGRVLIAGVGNIFLGDDGFGIETVRRLGAQELPERVEVVDFGVRGVHLAYQLLDGYRTLVLVDATARGGVPGTVYLIDATSGPVEQVDPVAAAVLDGHRMGPDAVLGLLAALAAGTGGSPPERVLVVGCEPASLEEGIGLSAPVAAAVDEAVAVIRCLLAESDPSGRPVAHRAQRKASSC
ncbi:hydrogenase maturation protease [Kitasatospora sp. NBC_01287]|uniref:hydrogenase maturation protease n=1 Tax=Kitasatospora sp. NBC_01287 TaxID=2903573 RepID=UPI00225062C9|nr:hydrogenase maturation protease [Kitasatospora sp. NBC_01287]MCX4744463.1 hydrogenase maturation protease [Kitasatospora sp. NBC_01287]